MRQALAEDRGIGRTPACLAPPAALLERSAAQHRSPHQQRLMQDQHERGRHDVAGIGVGGVEQRHLHQLHGLHQSRGSLHAGAVGPRTAGQRIHRIGLHRFEHALQRAVEQDEVGRIGIDRQPRRDALQHVLLGIGRDAQDRKGAAVEDRVLRLPVAGRQQGHANVAVRLQRLDQPAGEFAVVVVDHRDRDVAHDLAEIGLRVEDRVEHGCKHKQPEHAAIAQHPPPLGRERAADAGRRRLRRRSRPPRGWTARAEPGRGSGARPAGPARW